MKVFKKILFTLFSLFLLYRTFDLLRGLVYAQSQDYDILETVSISFLIPLFITGVFAFPGFVFQTNKILPTSYYTIRKPDLLELFYRLLGVRYFNFLLMIYWGRKKNRIKYFDGTRRGLSNFIYQSKQSEFGHAASFIAILGVSIILLFHGYTTLTLMVNIINIVGNLYPVILQRYHRVRIERLNQRHNNRINI